MYTRCIYILHSNHRRACGGLFPRMRGTVPAHVVPGAKQRRQVPDSPSNLTFGNVPQREADKEEVVYAHGHHGPHLQRDNRKQEQIHRSPHLRPDAEATARDVTVASGACPTACRREGGIGQVLALPHHRPWWH